MSSFAIQAALTITSLNLSNSILEKIEQNDEFTTVVDGASGDIYPLALSLLSINPYFSGDDILITHIGILKKGQRVATGQIRIKGYEIIDLPQTPLNDIISKLPAKQKAIAGRYFGYGYSKLPEKTGQELLNIILDMFPDQVADIERIAGKLNREPIPKTNRNEDAAVEKDIVGLCLDIFGEDRSKILQSWKSSTGEKSVGKSFLTGLPEYSAYEDDLINHDLSNLPGWEVVQKDITGVVEFENAENERLVIINANRKPMEKALGVDLIYFHRKYEAFTFVQYKMMDQKVEQGDRSYYNPNQRSQEDEQERMQRLYDLLLNEKESKSLNDYRIGNCPIFFKVCRKLQLKYEDTSIAPGAYIPLNQWKILLNDESTKGPKGGCQIGFHTLKNRYISTTMFVELMQRGFLGTQSIASKKIGLFIQAAIEQGHSVMYAIDERGFTGNSENSTS
jgi:hypothetical protein